MSNLRRRLQIIEELVRPLPNARCAILLDPGESAPGEARHAFDQELVAAEALNDRVYVVGDEQLRVARGAKVKYVRSALEAQMAIMAREPSEQGGATVLAELLRRLSGNVIVPKADWQRLRAIPEPMEDPA